MKSSVSVYTGGSAGVQVVAAVVVSDSLMVIVMSVELATDPVTVDSSVLVVPSEVKVAVSLTLMEVSVESADPVRVDCLVLVASSAVLVASSELDAAVSLTVTMVSVERAEPVRVDCSVVVVPTAAELEDGRHGPALTKGLRIAVKTKE
jgi:hypothetical protein